MRRLISVGLVATWVFVVGVACGGATGPQGPAGPPADRSKLYCSRNTATLNPSTTTLSVSVTCNAKTDIPWEGSCEASGLPTGLYLSVNEAVGWNDLSVLPGWTCTWASYGPAPNEDVGVAAEICCFTMGQSP